MAATSMLLCMSSVTSASTARTSVVAPRASSSFLGKGVPGVALPPRRRPARAGPGLKVSAALDVQTVTTAYGALVTGGGIFAYLRSGSKGSLISSLTSGALLGAAVYLQSNPDTAQKGTALAFGVALLLASVFGIRLLATKKPVPAGPLLALSLAASYVFGSAYFA
eukprot:jgi/Chlat1/282/Chrsp1S03169